jgi:RNA polymerase sigma-70 factor (ECF subfamily)
VRWYDDLASIYRAPVVLLNRAVAIGEAFGCEEGLAALDPLAELLDGYHAYHTARAYFHTQCGQPDQALDAYRLALPLVGNEVERKFIESRIAAISAG